MGACRAEGNEMACPLKADFDIKRRVESKK